MNQFYHLIQIECDIEDDKKKAGRDSNEWKEQNELITSRLQ